MATKTTQKRAAKHAQNGQPSDENQAAEETPAPENGKGGESQGSSDQKGVFGELGGVARDAAMAVLAPAVKSASEKAAKKALERGPELLMEKVLPKIEDAGGLETLANNALKQAGLPGKIAGKLGMGGKLVSNLTGGDEDEEGGGGSAEGDATGSGRRMPVQQSMDVAAPLEVVYDHWVEFEEYPQFMHRVNSAQQKDDTHVTFTEKLWGFSRTFEAEILEQRPMERIVWHSVNGLQHVGVVTFHRLSDRLTRIEVTVDFQPSGIMEKIGRGARFSKRAIRADMHRFKAYVEMQDEDTDGWRGEIEEGEVVASPEEYESEEPESEAEAEGEPVAEEEPEAEAEGEEEPEDDAEAETEDEEPEAEADEDEEPEAEADEDDEPEAEAEDEEPEAEADEDEEPEAEAEEEPEEEPAPKRRRRSSQRTRSKRTETKRPRRPAPPKKPAGRRRTTARKKQAATK
jgi:uncharacterized membrane protein